MLASTIQFSKYGQAYRHKPPLTSGTPSTPGKTHPESPEPHQQFGESRPQPHTPPNKSMEKRPEETKPESARIRPDPSGPNSAPRPIPSHVLAFHAPKSSTNSNTQVLGLMVNVPHSEAPSP